MIVHRRLVPQHAVDIAREFVVNLPKHELEWTSRVWAPEIVQLLAYLPRAPDVQSVA